MSWHELAWSDGDGMERSLLILFEMNGKNEMRRGVEKTMREKVNSGYVVENALIGCEEYYVRNEGTKGLCEEKVRHEEGLKMKSMKIMMFRMKLKD
nr:hypothetical protein [Tanacetum cinerariifolium]